jgi:site-specific recombinase XerD
MELKTVNVLQAEDGFKWLKKLRKKTSIPIDVPLLKQATSYFEKLTAIERAPNRDAIFPYLSNQTVNRSLKVIAEICGISKDLSFHLARHTFATTVCLSNGVSIESISKMLGHSKLSTTMVYATVKNAKISREMSQLQLRLDQTKDIDTKN